MGITQAVERINLRVAQSPVGRWFRLENSGHVSILLLLIAEVWVKSSEGKLTDETAERTQR